MPELQEYVGTMRVVVNVEDELDAHLTMDRLKTECETLLDEEDGDVVAITQILPFTTNVRPEETLNILKRARNALIKTRIKECYDLAGELDKQIHSIACQMDSTMSPQYDYSRMMSFVERIFKLKEDPHE